MENTTVKINMTGYHHNLNYAGVTESITISYNKNEGNNSFSGSVVLTDADIETSLEDVSKAELDPIAKAKIVSWITDTGEVTPV